jgi:hypothetical protein
VGICECVGHVSGSGAVHSGSGKQSSHKHESSWSASVEPNVSGGFWIMGWVGGGGKTGGAVVKPGAPR